MPTPAPDEIEIVRQIVAAETTSEVSAAIALLDAATWEALAEDLSLWSEYRFDNEAKYKIGSLEGETDPLRTRADYRNIYCLALGYPLFNQFDQRAGADAALSSGSVPVCIVW